jgi:23S rRNA pseudouridine2605 synthase
MSDALAPIPAGDRLAKVIARAGLCSRRDAELWIKDGRVAVNGKVVKTPAFNVSDKDRIKVDGEPLAERQGTRVWLYHKPPGLVVTEKDPEGRPTIFETLEQHGLPRVVTIGRLDINTEGLLLLTNDGGLKRVLELPATGWLRRYRVRAFGTVTQPQLDGLKDGVEIDGIKYGPIEAVLERDLGSNVWLVVALREGKNREVKNVLAHLGLQVNRLIRISFGPFQLGDIPVGAVDTVRARVLREQLGKRLADLADVDFDSDMPEVAAVVADNKRRITNPKLRVAAPGKAPPRQRRAVEEAQFRFTDRPDGPPEDSADDRPRKDRPGGRTEARRAAPAKPEAPLRTIRHDDGTTSQFRPHVPRKPREEGDDKPFRKDGERPARAFDGPKRDFGDKPKRDYGDRPKRDYGDKPRAAAGDRPARSYGDKPRGDFADRPKRDYGDKPRGPRPTGDRPARSFGDKPKRDFGDKPRAPRADGDRPARTFSKPRGEFADRPKRDFGDKPRPPREGGDRPARTFSDKPRGARPAGDRPARSFGDKPAGDKPHRPGRNFDTKPQRGRPAGDKPYGAAAGKPAGARSPRPAGDRPYGSSGKPTRGPRPTGDRPRGPRPDGDKPRGPRKPRA